MFNFKQILVIAAIVILTAFAVSSYNDFTAMQSLRAKSMVGDCENKDGYTMCSTVTDLYVGPPR